MATRQFAINQEPHTAVVGDTVLSFFPEVIGAEFMQSYSGLRDVQKRVTDAGDDVDVADLLAVSEAMRSFLAGLMLPESVKAFDKMRFPDRILVQLLEWVAELYGSGAGKDQSPAAAPGGQSSASS